MRRWALRRVTDGTYPGIPEALVASRKQTELRERYLTTWGARPLQAHRVRHAAVPLDAARDLVANGWPRPVEADGT